MKQQQCRDEDTCNQPIRTEARWFCRLLSTLGANNGIWNEQHETSQRGSRNSASLWQEATTDSVTLRACLKKWPEEGCRDPGVHSMIHLSTQSNGVRGAAVVSYALLVLLSLYDFPVTYRDRPGVVVLYDIVLLLLLWVKDESERSRITNVHQFYLTYYY